TTGNAVAGWTVESRIADGACTPTAWVSGSSEFSVRTGALTDFPFQNTPIGIIAPSPLGGSYYLQMNNASANKQTTRIKQTFTVSANKPLLQVAYAAYFELATGHNCCQRPGFDIRLYNCAGQLNNCLSYSLYPGTGCTSAGVQYTTTSSGHNWSNWQVK